MQGEADGKVPKHFHPLRILDFDPIPPQMSLISGIVHAWQPLAAKYDELTAQSTDYDEKGETLEERWEKLFRVAAVGWSPVPVTKGLLEQVLDRQEQVRDWQNLGQRWYDFVTETIKRGKGLKEPHRLYGEPIFVIMIDDVDLQVERIRELLPALRLLYHPNVAFLIAADWDHLVDTLKIDFLGQQNRLANRKTDRNAISEADDDKWAGTLAFAAATKVFPLKNVWTLRRLTLRELLEFPDSGGDAIDSDRHRSSRMTMRTILNEWPRVPEGGKLGDYLHEMAQPRGNLLDILPYITYRDAHQIFEKTSMLDEDGPRAVEAVRLLIRTPEAEAVELGEAGEPEPLIEYHAVGELAALFRPGYLEETSASSGIEVSARPHFVYRKGLFSDATSTLGQLGTESDSIRAMLAMTIQDGQYGVAAPSLRWNIRLALAWTHVRVSDDNSFLKLAFQWRFHEHPHPFLLIAWSLEWRKFVLNIQASPTKRLERIAYAWIFYQAKWLKFDVADAPDPVDATSISHSDWNFLLNEVLVGEKPERKSAKSQDWLTQTLPLLARPEIGLPPELQEILLSYVEGGPPLEEKHRQCEWLKDQRRRLVTDAIIASGEEEGRRAENAENTERVERIVKQLDRQHMEVHGEVSRWWTIIENE